MTTLLSPEFLILFILISSVLVLLGVKVKAKFPGFCFEFLRRTPSVGTKILEMYQFTKEKTEEIDRCKTTIIKNQMTYIEGVLLSIQRKAGIEDNSIFNNVKMTLKMQMTENGFENYSAVEYSKYVGDQIDKYREYFIHNVEDMEYINTPDFNDEIASIFNHARLTTEHWNKEIERLEEEIDNKIKDLSK